MINERVNEDDYEFVTDSEDEGEDAANKFEDI
jgi:hypothetical protein